MLDAPVLHRVDKTLIFGSMSTEVRTRFKSQLSGNLYWADTLSWHLQDSQWSKKDPVPAFLTLTVCGSNCTVGTAGATNQRMKRGMLGSRYPVHQEVDTHSTLKLTFHFLSDLSQTNQTDQSFSYLTLRSIQHNWQVTPNIKIFPPKKRLTYTI